MAWWTWVSVGYVSAIALWLATFALASWVSARRYARIEKIWLEVPADVEAQVVLPLLTRLSQRYQGTTTLVVVPEGCRGVEGKRLTLGWGFKPCRPLLAALREFGSVTISS